MRHGLALALAVAAGCSSPARTQPGTRVELRLLGANPGAYHAVLVEVRELRVTAGGHALTVEPAQVHIDLTNQQQAWLVGAVRVPDGVDRLDVRLRLDDFGGFEATGAAGAAGEIDARTPISFSTGFDRTLAVPQSTAILDLSRSLASTRADARLLLPQVSIAY